MNNLEKFNQWLKINCSARNTVEAYYAQMSKFFKTQSEFTQDSVNEYIASRIDEGISKSTVNQINKAMRKYREFSKISVELPKIKKEDKKVRTYITLEELEQEILPMFTLIFRDWEKRELIMRFMFFTGLRLQEILNLKRTDFDLEKREIVIRNTKGKKDRIVKFTKKIGALVQSQFNVEPEETNAFNISREWINYLFRKINKDLKYKKHLSPHIARHAFAKHCLKKGLGIERLQKLMGHADLKTTMIYANPTEEEACIDYDKFIR